MLVASMEDSPTGWSGEVAYRPTLSKARDPGSVAAWQVVCMDVTDPELQAAALLGIEARSDNVRGSRPAALQTAAVTTAAGRGLQKMLTFHYRTSEAEAMAAGVPAAAQRLWEDDPETYPAPERVWASWLCGEHRPRRRRATPATFADPVGERHDGDLAPKRLRLLPSVRVLGESVDTPGCDSVFFGDMRGPAVDILQIVGRALRIKPGEGKAASPVVPVFLAKDEDPDAMLTPKRYNSPGKVLTALRSHHTDTIEALAEQRATSRNRKRSAAEIKASDRRDGQARAPPRAEPPAVLHTPRPGDFGPVHETADSLPGKHLLASGNPGRDPVRERERGPESPVQLHNAGGPAASRFSSWNMDR